MPTEVFARERSYIFAIWLGVCVVYEEAYAKQKKKAQLNFVYLIECLRPAYRYFVYYLFHVGTRWVVTTKGSCDVMNEMKQWEAQKWMIQSIFYELRPLD